MKSFVFVLLLGFSVSVFGVLEIGYPDQMPSQAQDRREGIIAQTKQHRDSVPRTTGRYAMHAHWGHGTGLSALHWTAGTSQGQARRWLPVHTLTYAPCRPATHDIVLLPDLVVATKANHCCTDSAFLCRLVISPIAG